MKRFQLTSGVNPNFIGSWELESTAICDDLISYFEKNKVMHRQGSLASGQNLSSKNSIDINMSPKQLLLPENDLFNNYFRSLFLCYLDYLDQWPFLKEFAKEMHIGRFNLQRYQENQHFMKVHSERLSISTLHRLFAWMTYLNDVDIEDGGSTIFTHYDLEIQPRKGLTLIWPAEWTHAHKGSVINKNQKYIITGWMHFGPEQSQ